MATRMPYREQDDEQDPYRRTSPDGSTVEPYQESEPTRPQPYRAPEPEPDRIHSKERETAKVPTPEAAAPVPTFKELQDTGRARPPMPPSPSIGPDVTLNDPHRYQERGGAIVDPTQAPPVAPIPATAPTAPVPAPIAAPPVVPPVAGIVPEEPAVAEPAEELLPAELPALEDDAPIADVPESPESSVDLLQMLLSGSEDTALEDATEQSALDQLENPSPYDSDVVKNLYADLGAGIDTDYDSRVRGLDESMARRGLYGSSGKDFHSGRLADTELGRRDAKTTLARNLATDFAKSYGDYNANAISQGQGVAGSQSSDALNWLQSTLGYGQQGFENDLAVEQLNAQQDEEYQQLLQMMLAAGYGA